MRSRGRTAMAGGRGLRGLLALAATFLVAAVAHGESPCLPCHEVQVKAAAAGPHRSLVEGGARLCEACHGDAKKHRESGDAKTVVGKEALAAQKPADRARACLSCHQRHFPGWQGTAHARSGEVDCWGCHTDAAHLTPGKPAVARGETLCAACHAKESLELRRAYHHPVPEGRMGCVACHDVHGEKPDGAAGPAARCAACHPETSGPWVFPHRALEEGCTACHTPHGSVNRSLLKTSGNGLCLTCHLQSSFPAVGKVVHNGRLAGGGKCADCHDEVHGSNVDELLAPRFRR